VFRTTRSKPDRDVRSSSWHPVSVGRDGRGFVFVLVVALAAVASATAFASANLNWRSGVEARLPAGAGSRPYSSVASVSCASVGNCVAVGSYYDSSGSRQGLLLIESSGRWQTGIKAKLPPGAATNPDAYLDSVSCASAGDCVAVGNYIDSSGSWQGLLLSESMGRWRTGIRAKPPPGEGPNPDVGLYSVSCSSAGNCLAVGDFGDFGSGYVPRDGLLVSESSGGWQTGVRAPIPAGGRPTPDVSVNRASCGAAGDCAAIGTYLDSSGNQQSLLLSESSGRWRTVEATLPAGAGPYGIALNSVSCPSAGDCVAVGSYGDSSGRGQGLLLSESTGTWRNGIEAKIPAGAGPSPVVMLNSVSCPSAGDCAVVGSYLDSSGNRPGLLLSESSGRWRKGITAMLPGGAATDPGIYPTVSCASVGNCVAVGGYYDSSGSGQGWLLSERSGRWQAGIKAKPPPRAASNPNLDLFSVSCASAANCAAVGNYTRAGQGGRGLLLSTAEANGSRRASTGSPRVSPGLVSQRLLSLGQAAHLLPRGHLMHRGEIAPLVFGAVAFRSL
jgi:hypothetical protein